VRSPQQSEQLPQKSEQLSALPDDDYLRALMADERAVVVRSDTVFEAKDRGTEIVFLSELEGEAKILRIEIAVEGYRLFKTLDIKQAISLANKLEWFLREEEI